MSVPERAKKWMRPNEEPELSPMQLGIKFAALVRLLEERPEILTGQALGLKPDFGVPVLERDVISKLRFKYEAVAISGLFMMICHHLYGSDVAIDRSLRDLVGSDTYEIGVLGPEMHIRHTTPEVPPQDDLLFYRLNQMNKVFRYSPATNQEMFELERRLTKDVEQSLVELVRYTDELMGDTLPYTYDSAKWQSTFVMQGRLRHFIVLMDTLAGVTSAIHEYIYHTPDERKAEVRFWNRDNSKFFTPTICPDNPHEMLWMMDAYAHIYPDYLLPADSEIFDSQQASEIIAFNRLRDSIYNIVDDISHVDTVKGWVFDANDQETVDFMRSHSFTVEELIGCLRGFCEAYRDKLSEQQAVQLESDITSYFFAQRSVKDSLKRDGLGFNFVAPHFYEDAQAVQTLAWREYERPDVAEIVRRMDGRVKTTRQRNEFTWVKRQIADPPHGMKADTMIYTPHDPEIVEARRRDFERGRRSRQIPEIKKAFVRAVAVSHGEEICRYLSTISGLDVDEVIACMREKGKLPSDSRGRVILSVDHRYDLDGGGLNLAHNFLLVAHWINEARNRMKRIQTGLIKNNDPFYFVTWTPKDPEAKVVLGI